MPAKPGQCVYKVTSDENRAQLRRMIAIQKIAARGHLSDGYEHDATVCRLTATGLQAVLDADTNGITGFDLDHTIRTACLPGDTTHSKALAIVKQRVRRLSDED